MCEARGIWKRPLLVEGTSVHEMPLPTKNELLVAMCGKCARGMVCREARTLVELHHRHRKFPRTRDVTDHHRAEAIARINRWIESHIPPRRHNAPTRSRNLGALVDRMAAAAAQAMYVMETSGPGSDEMHAAWTRLAELEIQYDDSRAEV